MCKFCSLFRHLAYRVLPLAQAEDELKRVRDVNGRPRRIFLGDGNAFGLETGHLEKVLDMIRSYFPQCEAVNMDATVTSILMKSDEELEMLCRSFSTARTHGMWLTSPCSTIRKCRRISISGTTRSDLRMNLRT